MLNEKDKLQNCVYDRNPFKGKKKSAHFYYLHRKKSRETHPTGLVLTL